MCKTKRCKGKTPNNTTYCSTCRSRQSRLRDLFRYSYTTCKNNAKRRGIEFTITLAYFKKFAIKTEYIGKRGITSDSYTLDRKDNNIGYVPGNLQVLTNSENASKGSMSMKEYKRKRSLSYDWYNKYARYY